MIGRTHEAMPNGELAPGVVRPARLRNEGTAISNLIRENKTYRIDSSIQTGRKEGMFLLDESLFKLWRDQLTDKEEALSRAAKPAASRPSSGRATGSELR